MLRGSHSRSCVATLSKCLSMPSATSLYWFLACIIISHRAEPFAWNRRTRSMRYWASDIVRYVSYMRGEYVADWSR